MERIVLGLPDLAIQKVVSTNPLIFEVALKKKGKCPHCKASNFRMKDSFWRCIKSIPLHNQPSTLKIRCHKYRCVECGKYFNTRLPGVKRWIRSTGLLEKDVFLLYNKGCSNKSIAKNTDISVATVELFYHQMILHKDGHLKSKCCPHILGIDEHRFTRKKRVCDHLL